MVLRHHLKINRMAMSVNWAPDSQSQTLSLDLSYDMSEDHRDTKVKIS